MPQRAFQSPLETATSRLRLVRRRSAITRAGLGAAVLGVIVLLLARGVPAAMLPLQIGFIFATLVLTLRAWFDSRPQAADLSLAIRQLEARYPELQGKLLTAAEQRPDVFTGRFNFLQSRLLNEVSAHALRSDWGSLVSPATLARSQRRQAAAIAAMIVVTLCLATLRRNVVPSVLGTEAGAALSGPSAEYVVDPGDTDVERHQSLLVLLRFQSSPPRNAVLLWQPVEGPAAQITMTKSLDDPVFAGRIPIITGSGKYELDFAGAANRTYSVTVYDLPALVSSSIAVVAPSYTHREPQVFESAAAVTLIEGSEVRLEVCVNKPLEKVELRDLQDGRSMALSRIGEEATRYQAVWKPDRSRRWELMLTDADDRINRDPEEFSIDVVPNRRPDLKAVFPGQDLRVSPLQEVALETKTSDDFGIISTGVVLDLGRGEPETIPLTADLAGGEAHALVHGLALENYDVDPGDVVSFAFFADDFGPDGERRRTMGDLFFLEIRPFEETFREMEGAGGQSGMQGASNSTGQEFEKLIELQKQIVTATWNLLRRNPDLNSADELAIVETLLQSQSQAREKFQKLTESLEGKVSADNLNSVAEHMDAAIEKLKLVQDVGEKQQEHLAAAVPAVTKAFQGLIRLKPTDHVIVQGGQSGGGGGGGGGMSQQQLDQLELSQEQNRYETETSARNADQSPQQEQLAILNRLKELAQRQEGLNEKLKELDAELRTAQTAAEQDELDRQLKQLRDEQQDLLQDADALRNRMQQSADPSLTAETRKQLEDTRQRLVDAAESLQAGKLSQALNSGTRAEKELQRMQEDFRKQTSAQLLETLQQLRDQARELTEAEVRVANELENLRDQPEKSLRQRQHRQQAAMSLQEQRGRVTEMLKTVREIVQQAESSEPLASKRLYEAARSAQQQKTEEALSTAAQLIQQGLVPEAAQVEQIARAGLQTLKEGIDAAAESILGDEVEALKRAKRELSELSGELLKEMQSARGEATGPSVAAGDSNPGAAGPTTDPESESPTGNEPLNETSDGTASGRTPSNTPGDASSSSDRSSPDGAPTGTGKGGGLRGRKKPQAKSTDESGPSTSQPGTAEGGQGGGPGGQGGPLTGSNYAEWADRLRDVETLLQAPELQAEVSKIREQARGMRAEFKRHSQLPNWDVVADDVQRPLVELQRRLAEEIAKRESPESLVPTDRDPVPQRYRELVRKYYERLGSGAK